MAYYTKVLLPDEHVRVVGRLHWAIYLRAWFFLALAAAAGIGALYARSAAIAAGTSPDSGVPVALAVAGIIFLGLALISGFGAWARRSTTEIVVTDRRVIYKVGFVRRRTMEMNMTKVETVDVEQSITGRIFNFGTVLVRGSGTSYEPLAMVADPLALRTAIVAQ
jgi:uncharacterized membrane protein YdbT with pleckstrin-like domain